MKILHILEATSGGTRRHALDLLPVLQARGAACDLVASPARDPYFARDADELRAHGVVVHEVAMTRGFDPRCDMDALRQIAAHLRRHRPDIIHCHSTKAGVLGRLAKLVAAPRTPLVYTPHCLAFDTALPLPQRRAARWLETLLAPLTTHFIAVSRHEETVLRRAVLRRASPCLPAPGSGHQGASCIGKNSCCQSRVSVIHNGLDMAAFDVLPPMSRAELGLHQSDFVIGCFGRLTAQKNQAALIRALPAVRRDVPRARLLLVGGGEDEEPLRRLARRLNVESGIVWTGEVAEARPLYALCDIVAQPSRWEGCPYSILEAMAARRAIVAAPAGGVPELLCDSGASDTCGTLVKAGRTTELVAQLVALAGDSNKRERLGEAAHARVEDDFRLEQMVTKTVRVYEQVMRSL